jgi:hypothetical protein
MIHNFAYCALWSEIERERRKRKKDSKKERKKDMSPLNEKE